MKIDKSRSAWCEKLRLVDDYAYQLFLNEYPGIILLSQKSFLRYSINKPEMIFSNKTLADYYNIANKNIRKDKLEKINGIK